MSLPVEMAQAPSDAPVEENVQQDPQEPWSFTEVTAFFCRQSREAGLELEELEVYVLHP